jgi:signal peptidase I
MKVLSFRNIILLTTYLIGRKKSAKYRAYEIKEESMSPSLYPGEYIFAKLAKNNPRRGDVVIFKNIEKKFEVVKRVLGLPNEKVSAKDGALYINGQVIDDTWAQDLTSDFSEITVGLNQVFVLGDNRSVSTSDSRILGSIDWDECYEVIYRYWPFDRIGQI